MLPSLDQSKDLKYGNYEIVRVYINWMLQWSLNHPRVSRVKAWVYSKFRLMEQSDMLNAP